MGNVWVLKGYKEKKAFPFYSRMYPYSFRIYPTFCTYMALKLMHTQDQPLSLYSTSSDEANLTNSKYRLWLSCMKCAFICEA